MRIIYAQEAIPNQINKSIFLAGPSLRPGQDGISWRINALEILRVLEYDGVVFVPESEDGSFNENFNWETQVMWESKCLRMSDNILFHINRDIESGLLGLTTNDEWGFWKDSGKCILSTDPNADKTDYQEWWAKELKVPSFNDLFSALRHIIKTQQDAPRVDGERMIPQEIWLLDQFQTWYKQLKVNGNWISDARVLNAYRIPSNNKIFAFSLWVNIFIRNENRYKNNEFIFSRPDISSCVMYYPRENRADSEIILVSEFRSPVNNEKGKIYELPGGSSIKPGENALNVVIDEIMEETGLTSIDITRIEHVGARQLAGTILTHKSHLFAYELSEAEYINVKTNVGKVFGNEQDSERTELHLFTLQEIMDNDYIDWSNLGQIMSVVSTTVGIKKSQDEQ
jgi:8-oxo-dGTP pyrophosphatase MutT (NUDIX family)